MRVHHAAAAAIFVAVPIAASAQTTTGAAAPALTVSGTATIASDYRFRGVSQSDRNMAVQGGITVSHRSGVYAGVWSSSLAGWGTFGGANTELDLIGGYKAALADHATVNVGLTWYMYPGGAARTDVAEPYARLTGTTGPATLTAGVAYAPRQRAIGKWYDDGAAAARGEYNRPGASADNLYLWGDGAVAIAGTPVTARAHIGHSRGQDGLGPNATALTPTGTYWDWSLGADTNWRNLTLALSWVGTDLSERATAYLRPAFSTGQDGTGTIAGHAVVVALTAAF